MVIVVTRTSEMMRVKEPLLQKAFYASVNVPILRTNYACLERQAA